MNKTHIKILFLFIFLILLSVALYLRRPNEKDLDFGWDRGLDSITEREYYYRKMDRIINNWQDSKRSAERDNSGKLADSYNMYLIIDMDKRALWLEEKGQVREEDYCEFPDGVKYNIYYYTPNNKTELSGRTVLKMRGFNTSQMNPEMFFLLFNGKEGHLGIDFSAHGRGASKGDGSINTFSYTVPPSTNPDKLYGSVLVTEDEYKNYQESISASGELKLEDENKKAWNRIEKYLYKEIERQVNRTGYNLDKISVEPGPDYSAAHADIRAKSSSIIKEIFDSVFVVSYLKIDYLGNDNWYAKSSVNPKFPSGSSYRRIDLEFLINPDNEITGSRRKELIKKGRELQKLDSIPQSKYKAILSNGTTVEVIGICENPSAEKKWWGPDGELLDIIPYINTEPYERYREDRNIYEFVWRVTPQTGMSVSAEGNNGSYHHAVRDRYGNNLINDLQPHAFSFDKSRQVTDIKFGFTLSEWNTVLKISDKAGEIKFLDKQRIVLEPPVIENGQIVIRCYEDYMAHMSEYRTDYALIYYKDGETKTDSLGRYPEDVINHEDTSLTEHKYVIKDLNISQIEGICFRYQPYDFVIFKNVTLVPGKNQGYEIEVIETEE